MNEETLFHLASQKAPGERSAFLEKACRDNAKLRQRVEVLLQAHDQPASFLESPAAALVATIDEPITERPGTIIGPYKLLEQIGEGGFGVVFMAEQQHPIRRKVALKVLKPGMDTRQVIARFEAERQALALMDHPNIAKVHEAGETASGRPYFVMELVKGIPITDYCDQNQVPVRERLELLVHVCQAVQHAHQKGIIHRDIKPTNVLVTLQDGSPLVKIIDFGIAKALGQQLTDKTLYTGFAQLVGTPLYMSPEQAALSNVDVDTRSDIYSLGVLLYELLTGTTPFHKDRFKEAGYDDIRRIIHEEEPPKPSTRMSTMGQAATSISTRRKSDPKRLGQLFRGELDWIVMKCLEKDRNRRYETASALSADVQRYLRDEPVHACPPSAAYRLRKFARRNKGLLATGAILAGAVLLAVAAIIYVQTDNGELVVETENDKVAVIVNDKTVKIRDLDGKREYLLKIGRQRLRAGEYKIDVQELPDGVEFSTTAFTLKRGAKTVVAVTFNAKKDPGYLRDEALRWFPADATFFGATNMEIFPAISQYQFLTLAESVTKRDRFFRFKDLIGRLDRAAYAIVVNRQNPDQFREFFRITGSIKPNRLADFFRQEWPGVTIEQTESKGEQITFIHDSHSEGIFGFALALIGSSDLILTYSHGPAKKPLEAVRECLEIRAGRGASLPVARAKALQEIPANAWTFYVGETPEGIKKKLPRLLALPRLMVISASGTNDVEIQFRGTFSNPADAKLFITILNLMKQGFMKAPMVIGHPDLSASVVKAFSSLRVEEDADRVTASIQIPDVAWTALLEKMQDTPLKELRDMPDFMPDQKK